MSFSPNNQSVYIDDKLLPISISMFLNNKINNKYYIGIYLTCQHMDKKHFCYIPFDGITIDPRGLAQLCPVWSDQSEHSLHDFTQSTIILSLAQSPPPIKLQEIPNQIFKYFPLKLYKRYKI